MYLFIASHYTLAAYFCITPYPLMNSKQFTSFLAILPIENFLLLFFILSLEAFLFSFTVKIRAFFNLKNLEESLVKKSPDLLQYTAEMEKKIKGEGFVCSLNR